VQFYTEKRIGGYQVFYPKEEYSSAYQIPYEKFYEMGYRAVIFDIDNTLVPHGAPADERSKKLCNHLKEIGFQICLLSNNREKRVEPFARELGAFYICSAGKPAKKGYLQAGERLNMPKERILFVGDQIITDIIGANRVGYYSILVAPINRKEEIQIVLKRYIEEIDLFFYRRSRNYKGNRPNRKKYGENIPEEYR
jgi:hypothetical protein